MPFAFIAVKLIILSLYNAVLVIYNSLRQFPLPEKKLFAEQTVEVMQSK